MLTVVTIGVYGFDEHTFFSALQEARVDTLCDIRRRRGVRGQAYAFANSQRLQLRLAEAGIRYVYSPDLAPSPALRDAQRVADHVSRTAKRQRTELSQAFIQAFRQENLSQFDPAAWLARLPEDARVVALLCVEREPEACHRGVVAAHLQAVWRCQVVHVRP